MYQYAGIIMGGVPGYLLCNPFVTKIPLYILMKGNNTGGAN